MIELKGVEMKEIKFLLLCLYVAGYTSLWWATVMWKGIPVGPNNIWLGLILLIAFTGINLVCMIIYCGDNWDKV